MVDTIGFDPIAETLMLKQTKFTEEVLTQRADLPLPISKCLTGTMVVHLHSDNIKGLRDETTHINKKDDTREFSCDGFVVYDSQKMFPKDHKYANVLERIFEIGGAVTYKFKIYQPLMMLRSASKKDVFLIINKDFKRL